LVSTDPDYIYIYIYSKMILTDHFNWMVTITVLT
jgi:hypothetical protein